jgi:hypothetical protein
MLSRLLAATECVWIARYVLTPYVYEIASYVLPQNVSEWRFMYCLRIFSKWYVTYWHRMCLNGTLRTATECVWMAAHVQPKNLSEWHITYWHRMCLNSAYLPPQNVSEWRVTYRHRMCLNGALRTATECVWMAAHVKPKNLSEWHVTYWHRMCLNGTLRTAAKCV